jgi:uncharacterized membrane protein
MDDATDRSVDKPAEKETNRLEAFSDGVMAVIITIMVLELKPPSGTTFDDLRQRLPGLLIYVLSFTFIGIYWNNHHHLLRATTDALAYSLLTVAIVRSEGRSSRVAAALGSDLKGRLSILVYVVAAPLALVSPSLTYALLVAVALMWFVPDRRLAS